LSLHYKEKEEFERVLTVLKKLARKSLSISMQDGKLYKTKIKAENFLPTFDELCSFSKRKVIEKVRTRKGKMIQKESIINPTRPDQLSTIADIEKNAVKEFWNDPWTSLLEIREQYQKDAAFSDIDKELISKTILKIKEAQNKQWFSKNLVLKLTRRREVPIVDTTGAKDITKTISATRQELSVLNSSNYTKYIMEKENGIISWLPLTMKISENESINVRDKIKSNPSKYPALIEILKHEDEAKSNYANRKTKEEIELSYEDNLIRKWESLKDYILEYRPLVSEIDKRCTEKGLYLSNKDLLIVLPKLLKSLKTYLDCDDIEEGEIEEFNSYMNIATEVYEKAYNSGNYSMPVNVGNVDPKDLCEKLVNTDN